MKRKSEKPSNDLRPEYLKGELKNGVKGKYYKRFKEGTNIVLLAPDVAEAFPTEDLVNEALRLLLKVSRKAVPSS